jgi:hypothetical protein
MRPCRDNAETLLRELPPVVLTSFKFSKKRVVSRSTRFSAFDPVRWATLAHLSHSEAISDARSLWIATCGWFKQINVTYCSRDVGIAAERDAFVAVPSIFLWHKATSRDRLRFRAE